jgi:ABC-2 type transport system ATP-binding protein
VFFSSHILGQVEAVCDRVGILDDGELVAVDTVEGLREAVGVRSRLKLRVADDPAVDVADVDGVETVAREDGLLLVDCHDPRAKARVIARLTNAGTGILDVDSEGASLEDVFTAYTTDEIDVGDGGADAVRTDDEPRRSDGTRTPDDDAPDGEVNA